jgi:hypothetical protein
MIEWFQDLCDQVTADPDWIDYFAQQFVSVKNETTEGFTARVWADFEAGIAVLKAAEMIDETTTDNTAQNYRQVPCPETLSGQGSR